MNRKFSIALAVVGVLVLGAWATDAKAQCNPAKIFNTAFGAGGDSYIIFPADADTTVGGPNLRGRFWEPGNRTLKNEGSACPEATYMLVDPPPPAHGVGIFGQMGGDVLGTGPCVNLGCPVGSMILLIQTKSTDGTKSYFAIGRVNEDASGFDFSTVDPGQNWTVGESPRARITNSGRAGTNVNVNIHFDAPSLYSHAPSGVADETVITGYQVFRVNSNTDPGRNPAAWGSPIQTVPTTASGADIPLSIDCSAVSTDVFLGTRAVFDGGQFAADDISQATKIECDPTVAEPRFNQIQKKRPTTPKSPVVRP